MSEYGIEALTDQEAADFMAALSEAHDGLLPDQLFRLEVFEVESQTMRVMVSMRKGMEGGQFASLLREIASGFESGDIDRIEVKP